MPDYTVPFGFRKPIKGEMNWLRDYNYDWDTLANLLVALQAGQTPENITNLAAFSTRLSNLGAEIKALGALGDNATDDTAIFTAADGTYTSVYVSDGNYLIDDWAPGVTTEFWGPGILKISFEGGTRRNFYLPDAPGQWKSLVSLGELQAKMAAGDTIKFAAYGDSTTDGTGTTDHVSNNRTSVEGEDWTYEPDGDNDQNAQAPNAWPVKCQTLLRDAYRNTAISVWNCGYGGQEMYDGWANTFFEKVIFNNPYYGLANSVLVQFGLNDVTTVVDNRTSFVSEYEKVIRKIIGYNMLPILITCDPSYNQNLANSYTISGREAEEVSRVYNALIEGLADRYNLPIIKMDRHVTNWIENNEDDLSWEEIMSDSVHMGDDGHEFKAGVVAAHLFRDLISVDNTLERVMWQHPGSGFPADDTDQYELSLNDPSGPRGRNIWDIDSTHYVAGDTIFDFWVWCNRPSSLIYRSTQSNTTLTDVHLAAVATLPRIKVNGAVDYATEFHDKVAPGSGLRAFHHTLDRPFYITELKLGLNRVRYIGYSQETAWDQWGGHFEIIPNWMNARNQKGFNYISTTNVETEDYWPYWQSNALRDTGPIRREAPVIGSAGYLCWSPPESPDGCNVASVGHSGEIVEILFKGKFEANTGFVFFGGRSFDSDDSVFSFERSLMLFFNANITLYEMGGTTANFPTLKEYVGNPYTISGEQYQVESRLVISKDVRHVSIKMYRGWREDSSLIFNYNSADAYHPALTTLYGSPPVAGSIGGVFASGTSDAKRVDLEECIIRRHQ